MNGKQCADELKQKTENSNDKLSGSVRTQLNKANSK